MTVRDRRREKHASPGAVLESRIRAYAKVDLLSMFVTKHGKIQFCFSHAWKKSTSLCICHVQIYTPCAPRMSIALRRGETRSEVTSCRRVH